MKLIFSLFAFLIIGTSALFAQQSATPRLVSVVTEAQRFEAQVDRLKTACAAGDQPNIIALESAILGGMRRELERAEATNSPRLAREREIFSVFENFSFYQAKRADAEANLLLLTEFAMLMK